MKTFNKQNEFVQFGIAQIEDSDYQANEIVQFETGQLKNVKISRSYSHHG